MQLNHISYHKYKHDNFSASFSDKIYKTKQCYLQEMVDQFFSNLQSSWQGAL